LKRSNKLESKKGDDWFNQYQEIPELGISGKRGLSKRLVYYNQDDFKDASVIDFGCNMGQMTMQAAKWGASLAMGVE
jgi:predicted RNA methylase